MKSRKVLLIICDGWGIGKPEEGNAIYLAQTPVIEEVEQKALFAEITCHGEAVGLPKGQMGNSEVGHLNMGAGRIVYQDITRISKAIKDGSFFQNNTLQNALNQASKSSLHLMGLMSDGGVHSDLEHLFALIKAAKQKGVDNIWLDLFLDGRDTEPRSAINYLQRLYEVTEGFKTAKISSLSGRYWGMDRDKRWDRVHKSWKAIVKGEGLIYDDPFDAIRSAYERKENDEFVAPSVISHNGDRIGIKPDDVMIFFNFRADRAREITLSLTHPSFDPFDRKDAPLIKHFYCMVPYDESFDYPVLFPKENISLSLGEVIASKGKTQLRIAETEKYAHVTFFFNGGQEEPFQNEERALIPSPKVATYDLKPSMSAIEVTEELLQRHQKGYDFILLNFANLDMVGHTGFVDAAVKAVETVDTCLGKIISLFQEDYHIIITSDHGNAEEMKNAQGQTQTAHTTNPVPLWLLTKDKQNIALRKKGYLRDIADLVLFLMDIEKPEVMKESRLLA